MFIAYKNIVLAYDLVENGLLSLFYYEKVKL